jgi:hypothetical protein
MYRIIKKKKHELKNVLKLRLVIFLRSWNVASSKQTFQPHGTGRSSLSLGPHKSGSTKISNISEIKHQKPSYCNLPPQGSPGNHERHN